jgi:urease accessory protein
MAAVLAPAPAGVPTVSRAQAGRGELTVRCGDDGRSVVTRAFATSPLRLLTPKNHGRASWIYTSSYGGGLVGGDQLELEVEVGPGAAAFLSTQSSTKVYRSARGTSAGLHGRIAAGGLLAVAPDPVVCFAASAYRQVQSFDISAGGNLVLVDWLSSGRHGSGERWAFRDYTARLLVRIDGTTVVHDALALRAGDGNLRERLGRFDVLATVLILGTTLRTGAAAVTERVAEMGVTRRSDQLVATAPVGEHGVMVRMAGTSFEHTSALVRGYLEFLPRLLGDDPWARKW